MEISPIRERKIKKTRSEREKEMSSKRREIFGEDVDFGSNRQPIPTINGHKVANIKPIMGKKEQPVIATKEMISTALKRAEERLERKESQEIKNLLKQEDVQSVINDFSKLKATFPNVIIPEYDPNKEGELERLKGLLEAAIRTNSNGTIIFYKQALLLGMAGMEILGWFLGYDVSGLLDVHLGNLKLYDSVFSEMAKKNGGKGFMETIDPTYKLLIYIVGSTLLFFVLKWKGFSSDGAVKACTTVTGLAGSASDIKDLNDGGMMGTVLSIAPDVLKMFSGSKSEPDKRDVAISPKSEPGVSRIKKPKNIMKKENGK